MKIYFLICFVWLSEIKQSQLRVSFSKHVCSTARLAARPHALRPCARQPRGCHYNWNERPVMLIRDASALARPPRDASAFRATPPASRALCLDGGSIARWLADATTRALVCVCRTQTHASRLRSSLLDGGSIARCCAGRLSAWSSYHGQLSPSFQGQCDPGPSPVPDSGCSPAVYETS
jgi:hypothetical protein